MTQPLHLACWAPCRKIGSDLSHPKDPELQRPRRLRIHRGCGATGAPQPGLERLGEGERCAAAACSPAIPASICCCSPALPALRIRPCANGMLCWPMPWCTRHGCPALFPRFTLPALKQDRLQPQPAWFDWAQTALLEAHRAGDLNGFARPSSGLIATGDRFIGDPAVLQTLRDALPDLRAVEMEGAAVAQVAEQEGVPGWCCG